jgi:phage baseplate assembly protein W
MEGTNAITGKRLGGIGHLRQRVVDILATPIGTRVMNRDYGSRLPRLVDAPINRSTVMDVIAATAEALKRWERELEVRTVKVVAASPGRIELDITGLYLPDGKAVTLDGIEIK